MLPKPLLTFSQIQASDSLQAMKAFSEELAQGEGAGKTPSPPRSVAREESRHVSDGAIDGSNAKHDSIVCKETPMDKDNARELVQSSLELLQEQAATQSKQNLHRYQFHGASPSIPLPQVEQLLQSILSGNAETMRSVLSRVLDEQRRLSAQSSPTTCTSTSATAPCTMSVSSGDFYQNEEDGGNEADAMYLNYHERLEQNSDKNESISSPESHAMDRESEPGFHVENNVESEGENWIVSPTSGTRRTKEYVLGRLSRKSGGTTGVVLEMGDCDLGQLESVTTKQIPQPPLLSLPPPGAPKDFSLGTESIESQDWPTENGGDGEDSVDDEDDDDEEDGADAPREGFSIMTFLCQDLLDTDKDDEILPTPPPPEMSAMALFMPFPHLHLEEFEHFSNNVNNSWSPLRRRRDSSVEKDGNIENTPDEDDEDVELGYSKWRFTQDEIEVIEEEYDWYKQCHSEDEEEDVIANDISIPAEHVVSEERNADDAPPETSIAQHDSLNSHDSAAQVNNSEDMFLFDNEHLQLSSSQGKDTTYGESDEDAIVSSTITPLDHLSIMSGEDSDDEDAAAPGSGLQLYKLGCSHRELARSFSDEDEDDDEDEDGEGLDDEDLQNLSVDYSKDMEDALSMLQSMHVTSDNTSTSKSISSDQMLDPRVADEEGRVIDDVYVEFALPVVYEPHKTGLEPSPNLTLVEGTTVAGRYHVVAELGSAAFSTAYHCVDTKVVDHESDGQGADVCLKVIQNSKDFLDQSLDEIKVLQTIQHGTNKGSFATTTSSELCDENHVLHLQRYFYYREHLILVTELLQDNLYEFDKTLREAGQPRYFTLPRLCYVTKQVLLALDYVHSLDLIHCDVKPENIMMWSYRSARVKLIDFGSACYSSDRLSSYIQSRSYRAPEVVLGLPYNSKIDIWSLGGVIAEMFTGQVLFQNESVIGMLARMSAICGPFPQYMKESGKKSSAFFLPSGLICERIRLRDEEEADAAKAKTKKLDRRRLTKQESERLLRKYQAYDVYRPKETSLKERMGLTGSCNESELLFVDFMKQMLSLDPEERPSAREALNHPWIQRWGAAISEKDLKYRPKGAVFA